MIALKGLTKRFGSLLAVDGLTLNVHRGEVLGILGPNGAGKTTAMRMASGFLEPSAGTAKICGFDMARRPREAKRRLGYLPEGAPLYGDMTPAGLLAFVAAARGLGRADKRRRIGAVVDQVDLQAVLGRPIDTLSKGFKRRVGLAQAMVHDPDVLILDEPTDGLDPNQKHDVRALIREMSRQKAIVVSTHILEEVETVCTRAVIIAEGRVVADGTADDLLAMLKHHNAVRLTVPAHEASRTRTALNALAGKAGVEEEPPSGGVAVFRVLAHGGRDRLQEVARSLHAASLRVTSLSTERGRLDEVFRALTRCDRGAEIDD